MQDYLERLITEKGRSLDECLLAEKGHINLTWENLIDFVCQQPKVTKDKIRDTLLTIDFKNGDVFHYLDFLVVGMMKSLNLGQDN